MRFLVRAAITAAVVVALTVLVGLPAALVAGQGGDNSGFGFLLFIWGPGVGLGIFFFVELMQVLQAGSRYVLAIETSGPSTALVTSSDPQQLPLLVGRIVHAIENPDVEFQMTVQTLSINPQSYYFGDNVNMYGGSGNVGISA